MFRDLLAMVNKFRVKELLQAELISFINQNNQQKVEENHQKVSEKLQFVTAIKLKSALMRTQMEVMPLQISPAVIMTQRRIAK